MHERTGPTEVLQIARVKADTKHVSNEQWHAEPPSSLTHQRH